MPKDKVDLLFNHAVVLTMNPARDLLWDGAVAIRGRGSKKSDRPKSSPGSLRRPGRLTPVTSF